MNRLEDNLDTIHIAKDVVVEEAVFMKDRSVFKFYKEDTEQFLRKCFEQDIKYGKVAKLYKKDLNLLEKLKDCLFEHFEQIIGIFDFYSGKSDYPRISYNDITSFARDTNIYDGHYVNLAALDLLFVATNVIDGHKFKMVGDNTITRYEFLEFFVRTA